MSESPCLDNGTETGEVRPLTKLRKAAPWTTPTATDCLSLVSRIDAEADNDEEYSKLLESIMSATGDAPVDQFYRVIQSP